MQLDHDDSNRSIVFAFFNEVENEWAECEGNNGKSKVFEANKKARDEFVKKEGCAYIKVEVNDRENLVAPKTRISISPKSDSFCKDIQQKATDRNHGVFKNIVVWKD